MRFFSFSRIIAPHLLVFVFIISLSSKGYSQGPDAASVNDLNNSFHNAYGPDQNLVSGLRFIPRHMRTEGHAFFMDDTFVKGKLIMGRGIYPDVFLKYDLYSQQLILKVVDSSDYYDEIIVTDSRLKGFELEGRTFRKLYFPETDTLIFQIIGQGDPVFLYHWEKDIIRNSQDPDKFFEFSKMKRKSYVLMNSSLRRFTGARSFSKFFPEHRALVMKYIREEKIRLSKAGEIEMQGLINYCNELLKEVPDNENISAGVVSSY